MRIKVVVATGSEALDTVGAALGNRYEVLHAGSLNSCTELVAAHSPRVVFVDMRHGFDHGFGLARARWLRQSGKPSAVVAIAASPTDEELRAYVEAGLFWFLDVDWPVAQQRERIRRATSLSRKRRAWSACVRVAAPALSRRRA